MARTARQPEAKPEPEIRSFALVQARGGWAVRTLLTQGDRVVAYEDSDADTLAASIGRIHRELLRAE